MQAHGDKGRQRPCPSGPPWDWVCCSQPVMEQMGQVPAWPQGPAVPARPVKDITACPPSPQAPSAQPRAPISSGKTGSLGFATLQKWPHSLPLSGRFPSCVELGWLLPHHHSTSPHLLPPPTLFCFTLCFSLSLALPLMQEQHTFTPRQGN